MAARKSRNSRRASVKSAATAAPSLSELQAKFQRAILNGDDEILALMPANSRTSVEVLFGVYRNAYAGRLVEIIGHDHPLLAKYLGPGRFDELARAYVAQHPSRTQNARWVSRHLPEFARTAPGFSDHSEIADLAAIEAALNTAFDAADAEALSIAGLQRHPPETWDRLVFAPHPSAQTLELATNAFDIWLALRRHENVPDPRKANIKLLVWRQEAMPMARPLNAEEAMMWTEACRGVRFGVLCEMLATYDDPETAPLRAAQYLQGWLSCGLLAGAEPMLLRKLARKPDQGQDADGKAVASATDRPNRAARDLA